jgi:hypothetical protein
VMFFLKKNVFIALIALKFWYSIITITSGIHNL